jgi:hypothetical protein
VRIALIGCTGLLGDVICQTLTAQPDLRVVAKLTPGVSGADLGSVDADIVLWNNADEQRIALWLSQARHQRGPRVLATLTDGKQAALWELTPRRVDLGALSPQSLVQTIRDTVAGSDQTARPDSSPGQAERPVGSRGRPRDPAIATPHTWRAP